MLGLGYLLVYISLSFSSQSNSINKNNTVQSNTAVSTEASESSRGNGNKNSNANQGVAQGLSIAESMLLGESPWGFFFNVLGTRGMDEYADTWTSVNSLNLSYRLDKESALGLNVGYETLLHKHDGELFVNKDVDRGRYGLTDMELSYTRPNVWSKDKMRLVWNSGLVLPTSRASSRNSLWFELNTSLALRYQPNSKIIITPSAWIYGRQFSYDTANANGTQANSPVGIGYGISGSYMANRYFIGNISYSQTQRYDYFDDWRTIQSATARLIINATDTLNVSLGYNWRDLTITNEPIFDDDRSLIFIGVGYVF
jgi:hypothetical protein